MKVIASLGLAAIFLLTFGNFIASPVRADTFGSAANIFAIDFVTIGNPGNVADTTGNPNPAGSVPYTYRIGKFEISEQMIDKANALGGLEIDKDTRGSMKPATSVSWNEAARFINWLNTSAGFAPAYKFQYQPGDANYFSDSNIELWTPADEGYDPGNPFRNKLAMYVLPNVDEWYKAAYFDPVTSVYYNFPTGSDTEPIVVSSGTAPNTAVYKQSVFSSPADVMSAGGLSATGTMGQGGNVWEWEETDYSRLNISGDSSRRLRGSNYANEAFEMTAADTADVFRFPDLGNFDIGFRVVAVLPEPSARVLFANAIMAISLVGWFRRAARTYHTPQAN